MLCPDLERLKIVALTRCSPSGKQTWLAAADVSTTVPSMGVAIAVGAKCVVHADDPVVSELRRHPQASEVCSYR
jgi:hypothetical protein